MTGHHGTALGTGRLLLLGLVGWGAACRSPQDFREEADETAYRIIEKKEQALGGAEPFSIERPMDTFRRRLMAGQDLPRAAAVSLGVDQLEPTAHWPKDDYLTSRPEGQSLLSVDSNAPTVLTLVQALQIGARNSFDFQRQKESVFAKALDLDLERNDFRSKFFNQLTYRATTDSLRDSRTTGSAAGLDPSSTRKLKNGAELRGALAVDLANLWKGGSGSSLGFVADGSITVPLLRGAGRHIVTENLTQAERDVVYALWNFQRFRRTFAVDITRQYLAVLQGLDRVQNAREDYERQARSARWSRRRADAGRLTQIQVDQAVQSELSARNGWISAQQSYASSLDSFKRTLGLPPDAAIDLDPNDLVALRSRSEGLIGEIEVRQAGSIEAAFPAASAPVTLQPASYENAGPLELPEDRAVRLALDRRLDLHVSLGRVEDAQRQVVVKADALRAELTLLGSASAGASRGGASDATKADARFNLLDGSYSSLLTLDLPLERTAERNAYRKALIALEVAVRDVQSLEDGVKLAVRTELRDLLDARESLKIQALSVKLAEKRVASAEMFVQAGRSEIRDLLEAQASLLSAQNSLTSALVNYRITELELQRDMGLLVVHNDGLVEEYVPEAGPGEPS